MLLCCNWEVLVCCHGEICFSSSILVSFSLNSFQNRTVTLLHSTKMSTEVLRDCIYFQGGRLSQAEDCLVCKDFLLKKKYSTLMDTFRTREESLQHAGYRQKSVFRRVQAPAREQRTLLLDHGGRFEAKWTPRALLGTGGYFKRARCSTFRLGLAVQHFRASEAPVNQTAFFAATERTQR